MNVKGKTANELRDMGYGVLDAIRDGYNINNEDDRFLVAYKGAWPDTDEFLFMHRPEAKSNMTVSSDTPENWGDRVIRGTGPTGGVMDYREGSIVTCPSCKYRHGRRFMCDARLAIIQRVEQVGWSG